MNRTEILPGLVLLLFLFVTSSRAEAQTPVLLRSALNSGGTSLSVSMEHQLYFVQQSVGQPGVIGLSVSGPHRLRQGFLQPIQGQSYIKDTEAMSLMVFPNPCRKYLSISFPINPSSEQVIHIHDLAGRMVWSNVRGATDLSPLNIGSLSPGFYLLKVQTGKEQFSKSIIKE